MARRNRKLIPTWLKCTELERREVPATWTVDIGNGWITGDDASNTTVNGVPFTTALTDANTVKDFRIQGSLTFSTDTQIRFSNNPDNYAVRLLVGNNLTFNAKVEVISTFDQMIDAAPVGGGYNPNAFVSAGGIGRNGTYDFVAYITEESEGGDGGTQAENDGSAGTTGVTGTTGSQGLLGVQGLSGASTYSSPPLAGVNNTNIQFGTPGGNGGFGGFPSLAPAALPGVGGKGGLGGAGGEYFPNLLVGESKFGSGGKRGEAGQPGQDSQGHGGNGFDGDFGSHGLGGRQSVSSDLVLIGGNAGSSGGSGGGGGAGATGGGGGGGGGGGAGGGGGGNAGTFSTNVEDGFRGGKGGYGTYGGRGGAGGNGGQGGEGGKGGAGGGAIEMRVLGQISGSGSITVIATGNNGQAGGVGANGSVGLAGGEDFLFFSNEPDEIHGTDAELNGSGYGGKFGQPGTNGNDGTFTLGGNGGGGGGGGKGGRGANGGNGGRGGNGGNGGGGAGGTVILNATAITQSNIISVSVAGGLAGGPGAGNGDGGRFIYATNANTPFAGVVTGAMVSATASGPMAVNPFIAGGTTQVPLIPGLLVGSTVVAEAFGISSLTASQFGVGTPDANQGLAVQVRTSLPGSSLTFPGYQYLVIINQSNLINGIGFAINNPQISLGTSATVPLRSGGWVRDLAFGGTGDLTITSLVAGQVYVTLIPTGTANVNVRFNKGATGGTQQYQLANGNALISGFTYGVNTTNVSPTPITGVSSLTFSEGFQSTTTAVPLAFNNASTDPNGNLVWSFTSNPGNIFTINSATGVVSWPQLSYAEGPSTFVIGIRASDGEFNVDVPRTVNILNVNPTATFTVSGNLNEGGTVSLSLTNPIDPSILDAESLRYTFATSQAGLANGYAAAGTSTTANFMNIDNGPQTYWARVYDQNGGYSDYSKTVTIANLAPTATSVTGSSFTYVGSPQTYTVNGANDVSGDVATLRYAFALSVAELNAITYATASTTNSKLINFTTPGANTVYARVLDKDGGASTTYTQAVNAVGVTSTVINNGDTQRSRIISIQVNFSEPVNASFLWGSAFATAGFFKLTRTQATANGIVGTIVQTKATGGNGRILTSANTGMVSSVTLTFDIPNGNTTSNGVEHGSLADGYWQLSIPTFGYNSPLNDLSLRRLYGDTTSTVGGTVDGSDLAVFGNAFSSANPAFDFNNDGTIDGADLANFGNRFTTTL